MPDESAVLILDHDPDRWALLSHLRLQRIPAGGVEDAGVSHLLQRGLDASRAAAAAAGLSLPVSHTLWAAEGDDGIRIDPEQFEEAVDERTLFVATSHVFFSTGYVQDIAALGRIWPVHFIENIDISPLAATTSPLMRVVL